MRTLLYLLLVALVSPFALPAQELDADVIIIHDQVNFSDDQLFRDMEKAIEAFLNDQKWTTQRFAEEERIDFRINMVLLDGTTVNDGRFLANMSVSSSRPVYGTNYQSPLLRFLDERFTFEYQRSDPLIFNTNSYSSELTSVLAYFAYLVIGLDYDTFSNQGGSDFFAVGNQLANLAATTGNGSGWEINNVNDRINLVNKLSNPGFTDFRTALYEYHRLGMDYLETEPEKARTAMMDALVKVRAVQESNPLTFVINMFIESKRDEIINVFSGASDEMKANMEAIMTALDPSNAGKYRKAFKST